MRTVFATLAIHHCHIFAGLLHATPGQLDNAKHLRVRLCRCRVRERVFGQLEMSLLVRRFPAALAARLLQRPFFRSVIPAATAATASAASFGFGWAAGVGAGAGRLAAAWRAP